jgi:cell volume regulation protein A
VTVEAAKHWLLIFTIILTVGMFVGRMAQLLRVPDVVFFLLAGVVTGPSVLGWINVPSQSAVSQLILIFGASYILFDGGANVNFRVLQRVGLTIFLLATLGVFITAGVTGAAAHLLLGLPWVTALLLGSVLAPTDPATLIPIFKQIKIRDRVAQTLISESAVNDATGAILALTILGIAAEDSFSLIGSLGRFAVMAIGGLIIGAGLGYLTALLIAHERYNFLMEFAPLVTLVVVAAAYLATEGLHSSGFMAVFAFGGILGNAESLGFKIHRDFDKGLYEYVEVTALASRMVIFILLGSQVDFTFIGQYLWVGLGLLAIFMLIARPMTVLGCTLPDRRARWSWAEMVFICCSRETGVIPAALAGLLLGWKVAGAPVIASITFLAVAITILIQAPMVRPLAKRLGLLAEEVVSGSS